jgi:16S rRNA (cytosine967-C5)-methyltransferase
VVDTAVQLVKDGRLAPYAGLANAVLRRVAREGHDLAAAIDETRLNTPKWLWLQWVAHYGEDLTRAIGAAHLGEAPLDISLKPDADRAEWAARLGAEILPTGSLRRLGGGAIHELDGFEQGVWWVQDAAAALPVTLLGDVAGKTVLDLCAAPGGKTAQLAAAGANVTAIDRSARRLRRVRENLARLGLDAVIQDADAIQWRPESPADAVLLDAPCSATGTIRRHPDVAWAKTLADVATLAALQQRLLDHAFGLLAPGGRLVYATCSLEREEGEAQIAGFLARTPAARLEPINPAEIGGMAEMITPEGFLRALPGHLAGQGGADGFFAARLVKA